MRKVATIKLKPGMKVGSSVFNANGQLLLAAGAILNDKFIKKLGQLNVPAIYIDDGFLPDVEIDDIISERTRTKAIQETKKMFQDFNYTKKFSGIDKMQSLVNNIIDEVLNNKTTMVNLVDIRCADEYTFGHSVNTCILSLITAAHMGFNHNSLRHLAMGALMHDLGKTLIPPEILNKPKQLTQEEFNIIQKHSEKGYEILTDNKNFSRISSLVVLHHHERYNGSGYPAGLKGKEINQFAAIVGLVDMYDAITADRVYRRAYSTNEAYEMISAMGDSMFDFEIVEAFLNHVAAYPVGSLVKLNTGEIGVVVENRPGYSLRPKIRILFSSLNQPLASQYEIDLAMTTNIAVTNLIEDENELMLLKQQIT